MGGLFFVIVSVLLINKVCSRVVNQIQYFDGYSNNKLVMECRRNCLEKFLHEETNAITVTDGCSIRPNCFMCWDYCAVLYESKITKAFDEICSDYFCFPGCKRACEFYQTKENILTNSIIFDMEQKLVKTLLEEILQEEKPTLEKLPSEMTDKGLYKTMKPQFEEHHVFQDKNMIIEDDTKTFHEINFLLSNDYVNDEQSHREDAMDIPEDSNNQDYNDYINLDALNDIIDSLESPDDQINT